MKQISIGVVGATGMVGTEFLKIIEEKLTKKSGIKLNDLRLFASETSKGKSLNVLAQNWPIRILEKGCFKGLDIVFFSSGDEVSREWAPQAVKEGAFAIDNSAAFRMDKKTLLVVPEVNGKFITKKIKPQIIANPNCSTIQLVVALKPLMDKFGLSSVKVCTYQAVSGAGKDAVDELVNQQKSHFAGEAPQKKVFSHQILNNLIPQIGSFDKNGYSTEEMKIINETRKILGQSRLKVSSFAVRVPVLNSHSEAVWVTLKKNVKSTALIKCLQKAPGLQVVDDLSQKIYPQPLGASGKDDVFVGRIHKDHSDPKTHIMWVVADNIRKGAALNGFQIAEKLFEMT